MTTTDEIIEKLKKGECEVNQIPLIRDMIALEEKLEKEGLFLDIHEEKVNLYSI